MQAAHHFRFYNGAIRTKIGEGLRTLFVPTEPPPKRLLELLHALAFDEACAGLPPGRATQSARALVAECILKAAAEGERDPENLCAHALRTINRAA
jgi:hypothetical protein